MLKFIAACALACAIVSTAEARPRHHAPAQYAEGCNVLWPCIGAPPPSYAVQAVSPREARRIARGQALEARLPFGAALAPDTQRSYLKRRGETVNTFGNASFQPQRLVARAMEILPHPDGCPRRAFCGCGASIKVFGKNIRPLWLAANWFGFPRAAPGPGMAEVRRHHVRIIEADLGGGLYQFYDANSGRGLTRRHTDTIKGTIVNPHGGSRYASAM